MDTQTEGFQTTLTFSEWDQALMVLEKIFPNMPEPRREKCETLFHLARKANGIILELGTYHGNGTISLCFGAKNNHKSTVITIDQYVERTGWAGEVYVPEDRNIFWTNVQMAGVHPTLLIDDINVLAQGWEAPISLLFWDPGCRNVSMNSFLAWHKHIKKGGIYAIHDTNDQTLGSKETIEHAKTKGFFYQGVRPGGVHILQKTS